jgi:hypothetical protein
MKKFMSLAASTALICAGIGLIPMQASADHASKWIRFHQPDIRVPAGEACAFAVKEHVLFDREFFKVLATYRDGSHQAELFRGPLIMRYRNLHTGSSVVENLSGRGRVTYYRNGDFASITVVTGHFGTSIPSGNEQKRGLYRVGGKDSSLTVSHDGQRQLALGRKGTLESICPKIHGKPRS